MIDSTQLLTTIAQLSGGFAAIICGFIINKILSTAADKERIRKEYKITNQKMIDTMHKYGYTNIDLVNKTPMPELAKYRRQIDEIVDESIWISDSTIIKKAFKSLLPITVLGIAAPLALLSFGIIQLSISLQVIILSGFIVGLLCILGFISYYAWEIHSQL